jgi:thiol-disulfide isomerase/thioredoxin
MRVLNIKSAGQRVRRMAGAWCVILGALSAALAARPAVSVGQSQGQGQAKPKAPRKAGTAADPTVIDFAGFQRVLAQQKDKVVLVDFWATWCEPCRDIYPMVNELAKQFAPQGLVVIGVSFDDDGEMTLVRHFLERNKPVFVNYRKKPGKEKAFVSAVDPRWTGTIPADFLYDREGRETVAFIGTHPRADFENAIRAVLASGAKSGARMPGAGQASAAARVR